MRQIDATLPTLHIRSEQAEHYRPAADYAASTVLDVIQQVQASPKYTHIVRRQVSARRQPTIAEALGFDDELPGYVDLDEVCN